MIFIHDDCSVWKEGLCKFGVGAPHIADEELYPQAFFPGNVPPIISQMALGPIRENVEDPALFRINQNALIFTGRSIAFEFVNGKRLWKLARRRIANRVQKAADRLDGNTGKLCDLFSGKGLPEQGDNVKCQSAGPAVVAGEERIGFREPFAAVWAEVAAFAKEQDYLFSQ